MENVVEETDNRDHKGDKVLLMENCIDEMIQFYLMYPPFWFSTLESKSATSIFIGRKILNITISGSFITSSELSHMISTLDYMTCN